MDDIDTAGTGYRPHVLSAAKVKAGNWSSAPSFNGSESVFQWEELVKTWSGRIRSSIGGDLKWKPGSDKRLEDQVAIEIELAKRAIEALDPIVISEVASKHQGVELYEAVVKEFTARSVEYLDAVNALSKADHRLQSNNDQQRTAALEDAKRVAATNLKERCEWWLNVKWPVDTVIKHVVEFYSLMSMDYHLKRMKTEWPNLGREVVYREAKFLLDKNVMSERDVFYGLYRILPLLYTSVSGMTEPKLDPLLEFCRRKDAQESLRLEKRLCHRNLHGRYRNGQLSFHKRAEFCSHTLFPDHSWIKF